MAYMSNHMRSVISKAAATPHAGAVFMLRGLDPMWQAEIGEPRLWEVELERDPCGCNCPHCEAEWKRVNVECTFARDAASLAEQEVGENWTAMRVRPTGSSGEFVDCDDLPSDSGGE